MAGQPGEDAWGYCGELQSLSVALCAPQPFPDCQRQDGFHSACCFLIPHENSPRDKREVDWVIAGSCRLRSHEGRSRSGREFQDIES